jgi:hypothetical protein
MAGVVWAAEDLGGLDRLDLSGPAGRVFALLDPNRAGKADAGF